MEPLVFTRKYNLEDADEFVWNSSRGGKRLATSRGSLIRFAVCIGLMVFAAVGIVWVSGATGYSDGLQYAMSTMVLLLAAVLAVQYLRNRRKLGAMRQNWMKWESQVTVDEAGMRSVGLGNDAASSFAWGDVDGVKITPRLYLLYHGELGAGVVPKSALQGNARTVFDVYIDRLKQRGVAVWYVGDEFEDEHAD